MGISFLVVSAPQQTTFLTLNSETVFCKTEGVTVVAARLAGVVCNRGGCSLAVDEIYTQCSS